MNKVMNYWTRISTDTVLLASPSQNSNIIGKMLRTYGVQVLDCDDIYSKVFSPDLNTQGYVKTDYLLKGGDS